MKSMVIGMRCPIHAASLGILFLLGYCAFAEKAPYSSFAKDATSAPPQAYYDYIIIGGGTAGCALAATLSGSAKVLILERGGLPYDNPNVMNIKGLWLTLADTSPSSASQQFVSTDGVISNRGRVLGGCSSINVGFYSHASDEYVAEVGWDPQLVKESYEWVEQKLVFRPRVVAWQAAVRDGLLEAGVLPDNGFTFQHLLGTKIGGSTFDEDGHRHPAADLLEYADPTNIEVYLHATVHQILFKTSSLQRPRSYGVFFRDSKGGRHMAYLNSDPKSEIILCAGAIGSPQLLMLSGIGPEKQLQAQGIKVVLDQKMVGQGMSDNPMNTILLPSPRPIEISEAQTVGISDVGSYIEAIFFHSNSTIRSFPFTRNLTMPETVRGPKSQLDQNINVGLIVEKVNGPYSTGFLEVLSTNPNDNPRVTFNYFKDPRDLKKCVAGMEIIQRVIESNSMSTFLYPHTSFQSLVKLMVETPTNLRPRRNPSTPNYSMEQFCVDTVQTMWHYHGGCQVDRVVDSDYKVLGVDSLRVVDGSTFYKSPGTNPQATVLMLGRYVGQKILGERKRK